MEGERLSMGSVILEESYSSRLREVYKLQQGPRTLDELARIWNQRLLNTLETERGKRQLDGLIRGELVYGGTTAETRHVVHVRNGKTVHVYCAMDAVIEGFFQDVEVESSCPHCDDSISLKMVDRQIVSVSPESTVLWLGISPKGEGPTTEVLCPYINFLSSPSHAKEWREKNPEQVGVLITLSQVQDFITKALPHAPVSKPAEAK